MLNNDYSKIKCIPNTSFNHLTVCMYNFEHSTPRYFDDQLIIILLVINYYLPFWT